MVIFFHMWWCYSSLCELNETQKTKKLLILFLWPVHYHNASIIVCELLMHSLDEIASETQKMRELYCDRLSLGQSSISLTQVQWFMNYLTLSVGSYGLVYPTFTVLFPDPTLERERSGPLSVFLGLMTFHFWILAYQSDSCHVVCPWLSCDTAL